jgi:hypothetical protein
MELIGQRDGGMGTTSKSPAYWNAYVRALGKKQRVAIPSHAHVAFVAEWIHRELAAQTNDILRDTFGEKARAYVAVQMLFARQALSSIENGNITTHALLSQLIDRLERQAPGTRQFVEEHIAEHARVAAEQATAANQKADRILASLEMQGAIEYLQELVPPPPLNYVPRPGRMQALVDALWRQGRVGVSGSGPSTAARAAAQGDARVRPTVRRSVSWWLLSYRCRESVS